MSGNAVQIQADQCRLILSKPEAESQLDTADSMSKPSLGIVTQNSDWAIPQFTALKSTNVYQIALKIQPKTRSTKVEVQTLMFSQVVQADEPPACKSIKKQT